MIKNASDLHTHATVEESMIDANQAPSASADSGEIKALDDSKRICICDITNNLPYSCIIELDIPENVNTIYYAAQTKDHKHFFKAAIVKPGKHKLSSFSVHDFDEPVKNFTFKVWGLHDGTVETNPSTMYLGYPSANTEIGNYDLQLKGLDRDDTHLISTEILPILYKHYGKSALPSITTVEYADRDVYIPSKDQIILSPSKHNLIHELLHCSRKQLLFSSKDYRFNDTNEIIEESFAEGIANSIKDEMFQDKPEIVYGSTMGYNYDFRIQDESLASTCLQSTRGGILNLELARYYLGSEAYAKLAMSYWKKTKKYLGRDFNKEYYNRVKNAGINPTREMFIDIMSDLVTNVEDEPINQWLDRNPIFRAKFFPGNKIFMSIQDYYIHKSYLAIMSINVYETFPNGSDWAYGDERYSKNGDKIHMEIEDLEGNILSSKSYVVPEYPNGFGTVKIYCYGSQTDESMKQINRSLDHLVEQDVTFSQISHIVPIDYDGLCKINIYYKELVKTYYRIIGNIMDRGKDAIIVATPNIADGNHLGCSWESVNYNRDEGKSFIFPNKIIKNGCCILTNHLSDNFRNSSPGILTIVGESERYTRNIGYGGRYGGHQILLR